MLSEYEKERIRDSILEVWETNKATTDRKAIFVVVRKWITITPYAVHEFNEINGTYRGTYLKSAVDVQKILKEYGATKRIDLRSFIDHYLSDESIERKDVEKNNIKR